jgi:Tfp pilus assembly protein PilE
MFRFNGNQSMIKGNAGVTITETVIAVTISSILFLFVMMVYSAFINASGLENKETNIQNELMNAYRFLEKDIFKSGFNVPGSGVYASMASIGNDEMHLLYNENETTTSLHVSAQLGDSVLVVDDYKGALPNQWVCLKQNSSVSYYQINRVGVGDGAVPDTLSLNSKTISTWNQTTTKVYFAKSFRWSVGPVSNQISLERRTLTNSYGFSTIDSIKITVNDASGNPMSAPFTLGSSLGIRLVGHDGPIAKNSFCTKTFSIKLRNNQ